MNQQLIKPPEVGTLKPGPEPTLQHVEQLRDCQRIAWQVYALTHTSPGSVLPTGQSIDEDDDAGG